MSARKSWHNCSRSLPEEYPMQAPEREVRLQSPLQEQLAAFSTLELAQVLVERLSLTDADWHRFKGNRGVRAREQAAVALLALLRDNRDEALIRLQQANGWLDGSVSAPPCPDHARSARP
jgi:hypothetical protein